MKTNVPSSLAQSLGDPICLYADPWQLQSAGTPLPFLEDEAAKQAVLVSADVIRTYQRMIFGLQMQVLRYKVLLEQFTRRPEAVEEFSAEPSTPLSQTSIHVIDSIVQAKIAEESIFRAYEDEET